MAALTSARRIVVKIGSALLVGPDGLRSDWLASLCEDVRHLKNQADVVLVSSGSIALGRRVLGLTGALTLDQAQAAAAVGQIRLARAYEAALAPLTAAQVLVTLEDSANRRRYLNSRATMQTLLSLGAVPIVNENDTVATDEIRYGDNDRLAAQVAVTIGADQLVLLSDVDGLYTANPNLDADAQHIAQVPDITPQIEAMAGDAASHLSRGGMRTKLMAAKLATAGGCAMAITSGLAHNPLTNMGKATWFLPKSDPQTARKTWIAAMSPKGSVTIDAGAAAALRTGNSLLPAGVTEVSGQFDRGDPVQITHDGVPLGLGLIRYTPAEAQQVKGLRSDLIADTLGHAARSALIHRDDMVIG